MLNLNKRTKTKPKPTLGFKNCSYVCVGLSLCTTVVHNTAQNSSDKYRLKHGLQLIMKIFYSPYLVENIK